MFSLITRDLFDNDDSGHEYKIEPFYLLDLKITGFIHDNVN